LLVSDSGLIAGAQVSVKNKGAAAVFLGGSSGVTTSNGLELGAGEVAKIKLGPGESLFAIAGSAQIVHLLITKN